MNWLRTDPTALQLTARRYVYCTEASAAPGTGPHGAPPTSAFRQLKFHGKYYFANMYFDLKRKGRP